MNPPDAKFRLARVLALTLFVCLLFIQGASSARSAHQPLFLQGPDLAITKTHRNSFYQGQKLAEFIITVTNVGDAAFTGGVQVVDQLPQGLAYTSMADSTATWTCTNYQAERRVECGRALLLAAGASSSFSLFTSVRADAPAQVTNTIDLIAAADPNPSNNHAEDTVAVLSDPDLLVKMSSPSLTIRQGQNDVVLTLMVSNIGTGPTSAPVTVTGQLPDGLIAKRIQGAGWSCNLAELTCTRADPLPVQGSYPNISLTVDVGQDAPSQVSSIVTATVEGEINPENNSDSIFFKVQQAADLSLTIIHDGDFRQGQTGALYKLRVSNIASGPTNSPVTVTDLLPEGLDAVSMEGFGWNCSVALVSCTYSGMIISNHTAPEILLRVQVAEDAPPEVTNHAVVSGGGEFNTSNNSAEDRTVIVQIPDLTITKTHSGSFYQGQTGAQYTITVSNIGAGPVFGDVLVQEYPPEHIIPWLTITAMSGPGWTCSMIHFNCLRNDDTGLLPGRSYPPITVTVDVSDLPYVLELNNVVEVSHSGELNTANNRAEDRTIVQPHVDLRIDLTHEGFFSQGQEGAEYTLTVTNEGSHPPAGPVTVTDDLPAGLAAISMGGEGWQCVLSTLTCTYWEVLQPGATYPPITLTVDVAQNAPGLVENRARVTASGDIDPSDDQDVDPTAIYPAPDLTAAMTVEGMLVRGKSGAVFSVTVANTGGRADSLITLKAPLVTGLNLVSMAGDGWQCSMVTRACTRSDLLHSGFSYPPVRIAVEAASSAGDTITHTVTVSGGGEWNTANSSATMTVPVYTPPVVTAHPQMAPGCLGGEVSFTAQASGVPAPGVQWQVSADSGLTWADLPGEKQQTLRFNLLSAHIGKRYRAVFRSIAGEAFSQPASVDLHTPLAFVIHPADQTTALGQPVTFEAEVTGHPWEITWQVSPDGAAWQAIPGASGKKLTFIPRPLYDGWLVRAEASNACGVASSQAARLWLPHLSLYLAILSR